MPKRYFQMIPTVDYDVAGDGTTKVAIDVLRRVKLRADAMLDGAIFYDYQMQDGDNAEIIADKYYGSSQYHWIVLMMNNIIDHTYDLTLGDHNFESYINATYGSYPRASGVTIQLEPQSSGIVSEARSTEATFEPQSKDKNGNKVKASPYGNTGLTSGSFPAGNTTAIWIDAPTASDPLKNIDVGDTVHIFIPERWYEEPSTESHTGTIIATEEVEPNKNIRLAADASDISHRYAEGFITILSEGTGTTGIAGNTRNISAYDAVDKIATVDPSFGDSPVLVEGKEWEYLVSFDPGSKFSLISYTAPAKVVAKSTCRIGDDSFSAISNPNSIWIPNDNEATRRFQLNIETDSTTFARFGWDSNQDSVSIQTGIHHFEQDLYDASGSVLLVEKVYISQEQYVNTSVGTASTKRLISCIDYEYKANADKRTIRLLKKEYLSDFVEEFETLMNFGV
jgi:hypothetical protein